MAIFRAIFRRGRFLALLQMIPTVTSDTVVILISL